MFTLPLGIYIHLPWCIRKCPYCDFNSHAVPDDMPEEAYIDAILREIDYRLERISHKPIHTLFFGGGTPSLFSARQLDRLLQKLEHTLGFEKNIEVTLEANPGAADERRFTDYKAIGINRLSIGIQSFNDEHLQKLGRVHSSKEALQAFQSARNAGFNNVNIDLMYALPKQSIDQALTDVAQAIDLNPEHLSVYQLTLEPNTLFYQHPPPLPDTDLAWDMHMAIEQRLKQAGYMRYEVSNYAKKGLSCRHNLNYWRYGDYLGLGAGAHGKLSGIEIMRYWNIKHPKQYMAHAGTAAMTGGTTRPDEQNIAFEYMLNALRLEEAIKLTDFKARTGLSETHLEPALSQALAKKLLQRKKDRLTPTRLGRRFLNDLTALFLPA